MEYYSPRNISETLNILRKCKGKACLVAGATNVGPDMRAKTIRPHVLIDISHLNEISFIKEEKKRVRIGGLTTIAEIAASEIIQKYVPLLREAADQLGNPLVRNRATIAGNLANASPAADTAVPLLVLDATVITGRYDGKSRKVPIDRFFLGPNKTALRRDEIIREIVFSKPGENIRMAYTKLGLRNSMAISIVSVAVLAEMEGNEVRNVRVGLGAVAPKPLRAYGVEESLTGKEITADLIGVCCEQMKKEINPITDIRASAEYRGEMAGVLLGRLMRQVTGLRV